MHLLTIILTVVFLEHSNTLNFDKLRIPDAQILVGDVRFRHDSMLMYCDSAYFYDQTNSLTAMGHVRFVQGDTLEGTGDILYYDGNTKVARMRRHVVLVHKSTTLRTDSLDYNRPAELAYFFGGGQLEDSLNILTSRYGQYHGPSSQAKFRREVRLDNPNFWLTTDTLHYNTESHRADLVSYTEILHRDSTTTIFSRRGWYNTETELCRLYDRSLIWSHEGRTMTADTLCYDKKRGYGELFSNLVMVDSTHHMTLTGDYGEAWEQDKRGYVTRRALLEEWSDSLVHTYMHADTLFTEDLSYSDSSDSTYHQIRAYYDVRVYREDAQALCDSFLYQGRDSIAKLYGMPLVWNENNQLSADSMTIFLEHGHVDHMKGEGNAIVVQQCEHEATFFNQMAGKEVTGYVIDGELKEVEFSGNAETVFYPDDNGEYIGMNVTQSSYVRVYLEDKKIHHVRFTAETEGTMYPLDQIPDGKEKLSQFFWAEQERPRFAGDVFRKTIRTPKPGRGAVSASSFEPEEEEPTTPVEEKKRNRKSKQKKNEE